MEGPQALEGSPKRYRGGCPSTTPEDMAPDALASDADGAAAHDERVPAEDEYFDDEGFEDGEADEYVDELGRRHVRRAAPEGTEELLENEAPRRTGLPDSVERWRQRSATGGSPGPRSLSRPTARPWRPRRRNRRDHHAVTSRRTADGSPRSRPSLEQLGPRQSTVKVRSWLLGGAGGDQGEESGHPSTDEGPDGEAGDE